MVATPPLQILTSVCLTIFLLLTYRLIDKLKVVNICEMYGTRGPEVVVLTDFSYMKKSYENC